MPPRPLSRSRALVARLLHAALCAVRDAGGRLSLAEIRSQLAATQTLDDWALEIIESNRLPRWEMYLQFFSIDAVKAGYLLKQRGVWEITEAGKAALAQSPEAFLADAGEKYRAWQKAQTPAAPATANSQPFSGLTASDGLDDLPPEDGIAAILKDAHQRLAAEILEQLKAASPAFFERAVLETLLAMGYGGSRQEAGRTVGKTGDGGIDGVINEDRLGLDAVYLQAKRYTTGNVDAGAIRDFKGALDGHGATKGVFITTAGFTKAALDEVARSRNYKIVLIDGARLAGLMIEFNVGVSTTATWALKKLDSDYFAEQ